MDSHTHRLCFSLAILSKSSSVISSKPLRINHLSISVSLIDLFVVIVARTASFSTFRHVSSSMCFVGISTFLGVAAVSILGFFSKALDIEILRN